MAQETTSRSDLFVDVLNDDRLLRIDGVSGNEYYHRCRIYERHISGSYDFIGFADAPKELFGNEKYGYVRAPPGLVVNG